VKSTEITVSLSVSGWSSLSQTVTNSSLSQTVTNSSLIASGYAYVVAPDPDSYVNYNANGVRAGNVTTDGQLTFYCFSTPDTALTAKIIRFQVS
jgi:hypothetical protein